MRSSDGYKLGARTRKRYTKRIVSCSWPVYDGRCFMNRRAHATGPSHATTTSCAATVLAAVDDVPVITAISGASNQALGGGDNACPLSELSQFIRHAENSSKNIRRKKARMQSVIMSGFVELVVDNELPHSEKNISWF
ncbi:hypothetical protein QTP88_011600 [Uroleucon formosanum]